LGLTGLNSLKRMMVFIALKLILQIMSHSALGQRARLCDVGFSPSGFPKYARRCAGKACRRYSKSAPADAESTACASLVGEIAISPLWGYLRCAPKY
jgi:hypothetical protein